MCGFEVVEAVGAAGGSGGEVVGGGGAGLSADVADAVVAGEDGGADAVPAWAVALGFGAALVVAVVLACCFAGWAEWAVGGEFVAVDAGPWRPQEGGHERGQGSEREWAHLTNCRNVYHIRVIKGWIPEKRVW